ncbi:MAG: SDR family oxidoreductase [Campylobacterales bacterium]|nr:SDR family oxidoreductase [Campylobacterales bacterium]
MTRQSILITGCSSGIGHAVAHDLHVKGYRVFATARKLEDVARLEREGLEALQLDVTDEASIDAALEEILRRSGGRLDALFNNAGYGQPGALEDIPTEALRAQFETNVFGMHTLTCKVLPIMRTQGYGRIIYNSSVLGLVSLRYRGAYNASKHAIEALADTMRLELSDTDIHVSLIEPGPITSSFRANAYAHFKAHIDVEHSAHYEAYQKAIARFEGHTGKDPFELDALAVSTKVHHALSARRPKARYYVTVPTWLLGGLKRLLGTRTLDRILLRLA